MSYNRYLSSVSFLLLATVISGIVATVAAAGEGATAREIYQMHQDGLSERVLLEHLNAKGFSGLLTKQRLRQLRNAGVPSSVMKRMKVLQEKRSEQASQGSNQSRKQPAKGRRKSAQEDRGKKADGTLKLTSKASSTVWFRIDRPNQTLHLSTEERRRFVGLSQGNRIQVPVPSGKWSLSLPEQDRAREVTVTPGNTAKAVALGRDSGRVMLRWYAGAPGGNGRRIALKPSRSSVLTGNRRMKRRASGARRSGMGIRTGRRSFRSSTPSIQYNTGSFSSGLSFGASNLYYLQGPIRLQVHGFRGLDGIHTRRSQSSRSSRGSLFDTQLDLNHDSGVENLRGSLRIRSGQRRLRGNLRGSLRGNLKLSK